MRLIIIVLAMLVGLQSAVAAPLNTATDHAIELFDMGQYVASELEFRALKVDRASLSSVQCEVVDYYLVMIAAESDNIEREGYFDSFEQRYPLSIYIHDVALLKALYLCEQERYDEALESFERVDYSSLTFEQREEYNIRMGYIAFWQRRYEDAAQYLERIKSNSELYEHALYYRSYIGYRDGSSAARSGFEVLLESDAYSEVAPFYILHIDFRDGKYERVIEDGLRLKEYSTPTREVEILRIVAESTFKLERFEDAIRYIGEYESKGGVMGREERYILGFSLYRQARYAEAEGHLRSASGADDALTQNASFHLADCYIRMGDKASAKQSFALASNESYDAHIAQQALFNYGKIEYELGGGIFNEAINILTRYLERYPQGESSEQAKVMLIAAYYNSRDYNAAYSAIKQISSPDAQVRGALQKISFFRGVDAFNAADYALARGAFQESASINISPKYLALSYFWQGEILFVEGDYTSALNNYNTYLARAQSGDEEYSVALFNIAYCYLMLGNESQAESYFKRFTSQGGASEALLGDAYNRLGDIEYGKRRFDIARSYYSKAAAGASPYSYYAEYNMAIIDGVQQRYSSKEQILKGIIAAGEGSYLDAAAYELGRTYLSQQRYDDGVVQLESFVGEYPTSVRYSQALSDLGLAHLNLGNSDNAIEYYDKAIKSAPNSAIAKDALLGIRSIYVNRGEAQHYFSYAKRMGVDSDLSAMARDSLSYASSLQLYLHSKGDIKRAAESFEEYLAQYPTGYNSSDALFFLSDCYIKGGESDKAINTLNQLLEPGAGSYSQRVYTSLSQLLFAQERYVDAADAYLKLYEVTTSQSVRRSAMSGYVNSALLSGDQALIFAMSDFTQNRLNELTTEQVIEIDYTKAKIYAKRGERDSAFAIFRRLSENPQSPQGAEAAYIIIENLFVEGSYKEAEDRVFELSESNTRHNYWLAKSFLVLGDIYLKGGDSFQARATYQSIVDGYSPSNDGIIDQAKAKISNLSE